MAVLTFFGTSKTVDVALEDIQRTTVSNTGISVFWFTIEDAPPGSTLTFSHSLAPGKSFTGVFNEALGLWYVEVTTGLPFPAGILGISAIADRNGQAVSNALAQLIELFPPIDYKVQIDTFHDNVGFQQGDFGSGTVTDDRTITLNGRVDKAVLEDPNSVFYDLYIYQDGILIGQATIADDGSWSFDLPEALQHNNTYIFQARLEDFAGNIGPFSEDFEVIVELSITIDSLETDNHTPTLTGSIGFEVLPNEYVSIEINGKTYTSKDGQVIVDQTKMTWTLQIPSSDALEAGTYSIIAALRAPNGDIIVRDNTSNELVITDNNDQSIDVAANDFEKATAFTLGENGQWKIYTNGTVLDQNATDSKTFRNFNHTQLRASDTYVPIGGNKAGTQNGTWLDINRNGYMDFISIDGNGNTGQQAYYNLGNNVYVAYQIGNQTRNKIDTNPAANVLSEYGGVVGFDKNGNGYADIAYGNLAPGRSGSVQAVGSSNSPSRTWDSQIVRNTNGNVQNLVKDKNFTNAKYGPTREGDSTNSGNAQPGPEISGVDLNNDGTVDLVFHGVNGYSKIGSGRAGLKQMSNNQHRLVVVSSDGKDGYSTKQIIEDVFQNDGSANTKVSNAISMTWADFNGNGYMDLFISRGKAIDGHSEYEGRILYNDGNGNLGSTAPNGIGTANNIHWLGTTLQGGPSLAVDWTGNGKMDIIELPAFSAGNGVTADGTTGRVNLYTNTSSADGNSFTVSNLLGGDNTIGVNGTVNAHKSPGQRDAVTGAVALDLDWSGAKDLVIFTQQGNTEIIRNTNTIAYGTALHFRILDHEGINAFLGNTVQLYDSKGKLVASQIINPQSGNQTNDTSGIVDFYGLNGNEIYSLKILRNVNGKDASISAQNNITWGGFVAREAYDSHVLTAATGNATYNANKGNGIVGTGYNDTFYATKGTTKYDGGGGWSIVNGKKEWSATGGMDMIDFRLADKVSLNIDLSKTIYQNTGFNTVMLKNIQGVIGSGGNDTFTGNDQDNYFNGRGGNDTYNLFNRGHHTLIYDLIDPSDSTGGNGQDIAYGFTIGDFNTNANADRIDFSNLFSGQQIGSRNISDYISVKHEGNNTVIYVDMDGRNGNFAPARILTLTNVLTDLDTLIANQQIIV